MAKETGPQKATIDRVMREFKDGALESGSGDKVESRSQAIAIGLSEAGVSNQASPKQNRRNAKRTRKEDAAAGETKAELYAEAKRRDIPGRSTMSKAQLARALA